MDPVESGAKNPYRVLLHQLTGSGNSRPRRKTARNVWCKSHNKLIDEAMRGKPKVSRNQQAALRDKVSKGLFEKLPQVEREQWEQQAKEEHAEKLAEWEKEQQGEVSTDPADRQRLVFHTIRSPFSE
jgi:hypothetical protein